MRFQTKKLFRRLFWLLVLGFSFIRGRFRYHFAAFRNTDLLTVANFIFHPGRSSSVGIYQCNIRDINPCFLLENAAFTVHLWNRLTMSLNDHRSLNLNLAAARIHRDHLAPKRLSFTSAVVAVVFLSGNENDLVASFDPAMDRSCRYSL